MQLISKFNKGIRFLLCMIDIFSKYAWAVPLKDKKGVTIVNEFQKILNIDDIKKIRFRKKIPDTSGLVEKKQIIVLKLVK